MNPVNFPKDPKRKTLSYLMFHLIVTQKEVRIIHYFNCLKN